TPACRRRGWWWKSPKAPCSTIRNACGRRWNGCAAQASGPPWMISAPAIRRSATCIRCRCASSRSTAHSCTSWTRVRTPAAPPWWRPCWRGGGDLPQGLLECFRWLTAGNQVPAIDDGCGHRLDAARQVVLLLRADLVGVSAAGQDVPGARSVQTDARGKAYQRVVRAYILPVGEIGTQQGLLERELLPLQRGPVQQAVGIEGVVDAAAPIHVEGETQRRAARANRLAIRVDLLGRTAVLAHQVL